MTSDGELIVQERSALGGLAGGFVLSIAGHACLFWALLHLRTHPVSNVSRAREPVTIAVHVLDDRAGALAAGIPPANPPVTIRQQRPPALRERTQRSPSATPAASAPTSPAEAPPAEGAVPVSAPLVSTDSATGDLAAAPSHANDKPAGSGSVSGSTKSSAHGPGFGWNPGEPEWARLRAAIERHVVYPSLARRQGWQGKVVVTFLLGPGGQVRDLRVQQSSGYPSLDQSAVQAVERAAPLPPAGEPVQIVMPIAFALR